MPYCRFEPQDHQPGDHPGNGGTDVGDTFDTAVLETLHRTGTVDLAERPMLYAFEMDLSPLHVRDLRSGWASRTRLFQRVSQLHPRTSNLLARRIRAAHPTSPGWPTTPCGTVRGTCLALWGSAAAAVQAARPTREDTAALGSDRWLPDLARVAVLRDLTVTDGPDPMPLHRPRAGRSPVVRATPRRTEPGRDGGMPRPGCWARSAT